jgi:hypothetical protein
MIYRIKEEGMGRGMSDLQRLILIVGFEEGGVLLHRDRHRIKERFGKIRESGKMESLSASVSRAIQRLIERGLIVRSDHCLYDYYLTEEGLRRGRNLDSLMKHWQKVGKGR